jgi:RNA polymerase-binding transcription factor DksA
MEMSTAYGKPLGQLTGAEGRQLDGWQSAVFEHVGDAEVLEDVKTEEELHAIHDRSVLSSQPDRRCDRCGGPIEAARHYRIERSVGIYCTYFCAASGRRDRYARTQGAARAAARAGRKCERCGKPIKAARSTKRFCSTKCRVAAFRAGS